jgi:hypothetical protein
LDEAPGLAEEEAGGYAEALGDGVRYLGPAQAFAMPDHGVEVVARRRRSTRIKERPQHTGTELQQTGE